MDARDADDDGPARAPGSPEWSTAPAAVRVVAVAAVLEAVGLAALAGWGVTQLLAGTEPSIAVGVFLVLFALAVAAALVVGARSLLAGRRSGRAPVATWQLLQGATAFVVAGATGFTGAWVLLGLSAAVFVLLMTRPVVEHTVGPAARRAE